MLAIFTWIEDDENDGYGHVTGVYIFLRLNWDMSVDKSLICSPIVSKKKQRRKNNLVSKFLVQFFEISESSCLFACIMIVLAKLNDNDDNDIDLPILFAIIIICNLFARW